MTKRYRHGCYGDLERDDAGPWVRLDDFEPLIAAAPEMAELLEEIASDICDCKLTTGEAGPCACCRARALLKRIKGGE